MWLQVAAPTPTPQSTIEQQPPAPNEITIQKMNLAIDLFQKGFYDEAEQHFRDLDIHAVHPDHRIQAMVYAAVCYLLNGHDSEASSMIQAAYREQPGFVSSPILEPFGLEVRQRLLLMIR